MTKERAQALRQKLWRFFSLPLLACGIFLLVEFLNRRSLPELWRFMQRSPEMCLLNTAVILVTLLFGAMFARRKAFITLVSALWIGFGITNYIVICFRVQPFTFADIKQLGDGIALITVYFTWWQIVLIFAAAFLVIAGLVVLFTKCKKAKINRTRAGVTFIGAFLSCLMACMLAVNSGYLPRRFENLVVAYDDYGFVYCFVNSICQFGIDKPSHYSEKTVDEVLAEIPEEVPEEVPEESPVLEGKPNILFVQLESFFDVNSLNDIEFNKNPIPNFTKLMQEWPSAEIYVPSVGGGTANTEFEVLTGMCLDFFGAGEYPYNTVLQQTTCETICYNLAKHGYSNTALHNYTGTFYDRNSVYSRLGFDRFVSLEYMRNAEYNSLGWCTDSILVDEAIKVMQLTDERDFLFAITVQTHGKYADELLPDSTEIEVVSAPENIYVGQLTNYVNSLYRTDMFIQELIDAMESWKEPVVIVFYGDHLPAVGMDKEMLKDGNLYETQYVIWNNYGASFAAENLEAYQLSSRVLNQLGVEGGVICRYHENARESGIEKEEYLETLELLEYDTLYGDLEVYDGENPYKATDLIMGSAPIAIHKADAGHGRIRLLGQNFNDFSKILINGEAVDTIFVSNSCLVTEYTEEAAHPKVCVAQVTSMGKELSRTPTVTIQE